MVNTAIFLYFSLFFVLNPQNTLSSVHKLNGTDQTEFFSTLWWALILWHSQWFEQIQTSDGSHGPIWGGDLKKCFENT